MRIGKCLATSFSMAKINNVKTAKSTYRRLIEFEEMAANIYLDLASRFSQEDPKLSSFWLDMAMHEKQHAGLSTGDRNGVFRNQCHLLSSDEHVTHLDVPPAEKDRDVSACPHRRAHQGRKEIRASRSRNRRVKPSE